MANDTEKVSICAFCERTGLLHCADPETCDEAKRAAGTPIADAFAQNRAVLPDAMNLIRTLERQRAALLAFVRLVRDKDDAAIADLATMAPELVHFDMYRTRDLAEEFIFKFPLDKV